MRVHVGAGYRVYFSWVGARIAVLLVGGDKQSQPEDIIRAKALARSSARDIQE
jgi:putative addiction module killer protein